MRQASSVDALALYRRVGRLRLPHSYVARVLLIVAATQAPLLAGIIYLLLAPHQPRLGRDFLLLALAAVVASLAAAAWAIRAMLAPIVLARRSLGAYLAHGERPALPTDFTDDAGLLLRDLAYAIGRWDAHGGARDTHAAFDTLTGLLNRRAALDRLRQTFSLAEREGRPVAIGILDVDQLGAVNARWGRATGDRLLGGLSTRLQAVMRAGDWAARWDGDAFLVLLHTNLAGASIALERFRAVIEEMALLTDGVRVACTVSAGGAAMERGDEPLDVLRRAEIALYRAKNAGHNCVRLHGPTDDLPEPPLHGPR